MPQIIVDSDLLKKLASFTQTVEICDPSGRILGRFVPKVDMSDWEPVWPAANEEELDRREQANEKRYTTAEVLAQLEKL